MGMECGRVENGMKDLGILCVGEGCFGFWLLPIISHPYSPSSPSSPLYQRSVMENVGDIRSGAQQWWILVGWAVLVLGWEARGYCSLRERKGVMDLVLWNRDCGCTGSGE